MAWEVAGYGIAVAALMVAAAIVLGIVRICKSISRLDATVSSIGKEAEATLLRCRELAEEARETITASKRQLQGFAVLAEGARAFGEAAQTAAQTAIHVTEMYRERLIAPLRMTSDGGEMASGEADVVDWGRRIWSLWKKGSTPEQPAENGRHPGTSAEPSQGE